MDAHIFVDNSNIFGGAQRAAGVIEPAALWLAVRVYYRNFFALLEDRYSVQTRILAGSVPPGNDSLWEYAAQAGYNTDLLRRIESDDGRLIEQGVDEVAHLKIANALLDYSPPQTLILATGDGGDSDFGTSFVQQVQRALRCGWNVEIWSWREQLSGKFGRVLVPSGQSLQVFELDNYYWEITFVKGGSYEVQETSVFVADRIVGKFAGR